MVAVNWEIILKVLWAASLFLPLLSKSYKSSHLAWAAPLAMASLIQWPSAAAAWLALSGLAALWIRDGDGPIIAMLIVAGLALDVPAQLVAPLAIIWCLRPWSEALGFLSGLHLMTSIENRPFDITALIWIAVALLALSAYQRNSRPAAGLAVYLGLAGLNFGLDTPISLSLLAGFAITVSVAGLYHKAMTRVVVSGGLLYTLAAPVASFSVLLAAATLSCIYVRSAEWK